MSQKVTKITVKEKDCNIIDSKREMKVKKNINRPKTLCGPKKIIFISLFIIFIIGLFFFVAYLLLSKKSKNKPSIEVKVQLNKEQQQMERKRESGISNCYDDDYERQVLLITNHFSRIRNRQNNIASDVIYNILKQIKTVNITVLDPFDPTLEDKNIYYLRKFNLVVLDLIDAGYDLAPRCPTFTRTLMEYVNEGGALFSGHDQFDQTHKRWITQEGIDMLSLLGFTHRNNWGVGGSTVYFKKIPIIDSIFLVNYALDGESIKIAYTHQTYSQYDNSCQNCKVILTFSKNGSDSYEYLVTNRPNNIGKTVNIRAGHTRGFTKAEKNIFLSSFLWLLYENKN